jgi:putative transposase
MKELPLNIEKGDIVSINGVEHVFERIDPDGLVTLRTMRGKTEFEVTDPETGHPRKPNADDIARLMASGALVKRANDPEEGPRRAARKREMNAANAKAVDPVSPFRTVFSRAFDKNPCSRSDKALRDLNKALLEDPTIAALPGARVYAGSTLREWINKRGFPGDRRARDGVAMTGYRRGRRVHHSREILEHHLATAVGRKSVARLHAKAKAFKAWECYKGEINRINQGRPTGREGAEYPQPAVPYKAVSYTTFWRMCRDLESSATIEAQHGRQAVYQIYGGGGRSVQHTRIGAFGQADDSPVPGIFLVDDKLGIPLGQANATFIIEEVAGTINGWSLGWYKTSSATLLETYAHANTPKAIPEDIDALYPDLKWICGKLGGLLVDNAAGFHSRHFEDSMLDVGTDVHFSGAAMPRDKAKVERVIRTIFELAFKDLPAASYDIPHARLFGFDPDTMVMVSLDKARELLLRAICVYHVSPHKGLDGRSPALVFTQHAARNGISVIDDLDEFRRSIGNVEYDAQLRNSGVVIKGLRYSDAKITRGLIDDLTSLQDPSKAKTKQTALIVKVKYSQHDMGRIQVWNERTKRYVTLPAVKRAYAEGLPLWAHKRITELARIDMRAFNEENEDTDGQRLIEMRKTLFETIANITPEASERDRATLAKLKDTPLFKRIMGDIIQVVDEGAVRLVQPDPADAPDDRISDGLGAEHRIDATTPSPRPHEGAPNGTTAPRVRRVRKPKTDRDTRNAGSPKRSALPDKPVGSKPANSSNPKWGTSYD